MEAGQRDRNPGKNRVQRRRGDEPGLVITGVFVEASYLAQIVTSRPGQRGPRRRADKPIGSL